MRAKRVVAPADDPRNKRKVQEVIEKCPITVSYTVSYMNP